MLLIMVENISYYIYKDSLEKHRVILSKSSKEFTRPNFLSKGSP